MILVFGSSGQLGRELAALPDTECLSREAGDLSDPAMCASVILKSRPAAVINAAAYTAVDTAEREVDLATTINCDAPQAMAIACAKLKVPFVSVSTDYVFDGSGHAAWRVEDKTHPLGVYGRSKLAGEKAVAATDAQWLILRTSWVVSAHGSNFVKTMLRLGSTLDELNVVADQIGGPTPARDLAIACHRIAHLMREDPDLKGIYHFSGRPSVSWADFAREIFRQANLDCQVNDIPSSDYPTPATRPLNSRLDCADTERDLSIAQPDWKLGLAEILIDLKGCYQ
ncbi:dTDP-4-dehydrorhamnose reductase [Ruegeria arenilitoris]|uniref:dTDP-4-dehydrorhamnose reductase n=1 Tax=Ruegeria arenilitoris TaxID=1173585 RepID=UPI00147D72F0|nr:dTDP-4-dehydrorhamnose reductase [Ruegeria arenilitoris]